MQLELNIFSFTHFVIGYVSSRAESEWFQARLLMLPRLGAGNGVAHLAYQPG